MKFAAALLCLLSLSVFAENRVVKVYVGLSPAGDFVATSNKVRGFVERGAGQLTAKELSVGVGSLSSAQDTRDEHLWEKLGGKSAKVEVKDAQGHNGRGTATLIVNKKAKPISFTFEDKGEYVIAKFPVKLSDYGIAASMLGVSVEDIAKIEVEVPVR